MADVHDQAYAEVPASGDMSLKLAEQSVRTGFIRKVYGILSAQLALTVVIAAPISALGPQFARSHVWLLYFSMFMTLVTVCAMTCFPQVARKAPMNYVLLFTFTAFEGVLVGVISGQYTWQSVVVAVAMTAVIFMGMTVYAFTTKSDFTGFGPYLAGALICSFGVSLVILGLSLSGVSVQPLIMFYDGCMALLFTMYIVYDTQMIMGGQHKAKLSVDDYVMAALQLYLDIINLFLYLLELFGSQRN